MDDKTVRITEGQAQQDGTFRLNTTLGSKISAEMPDQQKPPTQKPSTMSSGADVSFISTRIDTFNLNGKVYRVIKAISETSGEAQVYLLENEGKSYVLKLYYPNFSPKLDLLKNLHLLNSEFIVRLHDYGIMNEGATSRCFELMEYLEGGNLEDYNMDNDDETFKKFALVSASSLHVLHSNHIMHKDVKLSNFFFRDKKQTQLVLGDFGISSLTNEEEGLHRTTQARTPLYAAPEMYTNVINGEVELTNKADYYSLGITLLHLWLGENPFTGNERSMMRMKAEGKIPKLEQLPPDINKLIRGLTIVNPEFRWSYNEVERWFKGEEVRIQEDSLLLRYRKFIFDPDKNLVAGNAKELAALLCLDKPSGIRYLYSKRITKWLEDCGNQKLSLAIDEIVEKYFPFDHEAGVVASIYVLDPSQPFLPDHPMPTYTPEEIVKVFAEGNYNESDLKALTDGRLLLWLSNKEQPLLYDEIKKLTEGEAHSEALAFGVLYHLDRTKGFNLLKYTNRQQVGELLSAKLIEAQEEDDARLPEIMKDYLDEKGKLYYYCQAHQWADLLEFRSFCFETRGETKNTRCGEYNLRIALYRFCAGMGFIAGYRFAEGEQTIYSLEDLKGIPAKDIKNEFRQGSIKYWMTVFFHENPFETFEQKYSYERSLEQYLEKIKEYNAADYHAKRFSQAKEQQEEQLNKFRNIFKNAKAMEVIWFLIFGLLSGIFVFLIKTYGIINTELYVKNFYTITCAPIFVIAILMFSLRSFYYASGVFLTIVTSICGAVLLTLPAWGAHWLIEKYPDQLTNIIMGLTILYIIIAFITGLMRSTIKVRNLKPLCEEKVEMSLMEPLYFTYKTSVSKFRGSDYGALEDAIEVVRNTKRELRTHYLLWSMLVAIFIVLFVCYHPQFLGIEQPEISWNDIKDFIGLSKKEDIINDVYGL